MKTLKLLSMVILTGICFNIRQISAQDESMEYRNELRFGVFQLFGNSLYTSYERLYGNNGTSFSVALTYKDTYDESVSGILIAIDQKVYLKDVLFDYGNLYFSPGLKFRYRDYTGSNYTDRITTCGFQVVMGTKYTVFNRLVIDLYFGGTLNQSFINKANTSTESYDETYLKPGFTGVAPVINCTFGFKF